MAGMEFDSNVLAAIARGVQLNPLGQLAEGWQEGLKRRQAQQEIDDLRKYREDSLKNDIAIAQLKANEAPEYGTSIHFFEDPNKPGVQIPYQVSKSGGMRRLEAGPGEQPSTKWRTMTDQFGNSFSYPAQGSSTQPGPGPTPQPPGASDRAKTVAKESAEVEMDLPTIESDAQTMLNTIGRLRTHPGKQFAVGDAARAALPAVYGDQAAFVSEHESLKGQQFLLAYNRLRGAGQIANVEGQKGERAISALNRATTAAEYDKQLGILEGVIERGLASARKRAGMGGRPAPTQNLRPDTDTPQQTGTGVTIEEKAAAAIKRNPAARAQIIDKLIQLGGNPDGL